VQSMQYNGSRCCVRSAQCACSACCARLV
jgi:hypothetical protein